MRHLLTSLALLATFAAAGQTANPFPYNPDVDADGWISVNDLLSLLAIFTTEFTPESWETDSLSAAVVLNGNISYFECQRACHELEGHWRMADMDAFGKHWNLVAGENANHWVNSNSSLGSHDYNEFFEINGNGSIYSVNSGDLSLGKKCMCYLQSSPFVPDVLTSETAGLQEQIDSLNAQQAILTEMLASLDSLQSSSSGSSQFSLECIDMGVGPLCDDGIGFHSYISLEPAEGNQYSIYQYCSCTVSQGYVNANWRKFKIGGLEGLINPKLWVMNRHKSSNEESGETEMSSLTLVDEGNGEYSFYLYGTYYHSSSGVSCPNQGGLPSEAETSNALNVRQGSSGSYTYTRDHLRLYLSDENGSFTNTGLYLDIN